MSPGDALSTIRAAAIARRLVFTGHARKRMQERSARIEDVRHALTHATNCISAEDGKWKVPGHDLDGDELTTVVAIEGDVVVVTVF